jgi:molybdopterin synthase catalytic subunit
MLKITEDEFSIDEIIRSAKRDNIGALVTFLGIVRDDDIESMEVEAYGEAVIEELDRIKEEAKKRFDIKSVDIIHRIGSLSIGDDIVLIVCGAAHREEAFEGCRYVLEELKTRALIWKKEIREYGDSWVKN